MRASGSGAYFERSAEDLAIENAEEGCVKEAFGAAVAAAQAQRAPWLDARLDADARHRVREARVRALRALSAGILDAQPPQDALGLPGGRATRVMLERMEPALASGRLACAACRVTNAEPRARA